MKLLLDTHIWLWSAIETSKLSESMRAAFLQCAQLAYETADGSLRYVALDPRVLAPSLEQLFAPRGLRFDPACPYFGGWS